MKECLTLLNIAPLLPGHERELAEDIRRMYDTGAITENAFMMSLVPEGDPPEDKAKLLGDLFLTHRAALGETAMPVGILLQSTMGHGWVPSARSRFQTLVKGDGSKPYIFCPLDDAFEEYIYNTVSRLAALKPDFFMLDDDTRMLTGRNGCFCPLHVAQFNRENGTAYDLDSLRQAINADRALAAAYDDLLKRSMLRHAQTIRRAIDHADPAIPCSFCICVQDVRHAPEMAAALAAPGQAKIIRINNGLYLRESLRDLPGWLWQTESQIQAMAPDVRVLAEPDTCPHNNYSTSAAMLHFHLTNSLLAGCRGGKMWLTRTGVPEWGSGGRYRRKLSENRGFYEVLAAMKPEWHGVTGLVPGRDFLNFPLCKLGDPEPGKIPALFELPPLNWNSQVFGKMGYPVRFASAESLKEGDVAALTGADCSFLSDEDLTEIFRKCHILLDGAAAEAIVHRGMGAAAGLEAAELIVGKSVALEEIADCGTVLGQNSMRKLKAAPGCEILSELWHRDSRYSPEKRYIAPGAILFRNSSGHTVISMAGTVQKLDHGAFGMLNETRKKALGRWLNRLQPLMWYIPGDDEVLFRSGVSGGYDILVLTDLSHDDMPEIPLCGPSAPHVVSVERLQADGHWESCCFRKNNAGITVFHSCRPLHTEVLRVQVEKTA